MGDVQYCRILTLNDIDHYLSVGNADIQQNIICQSIMSTVIVHSKHIYFYDIVEKYFKTVFEYSPANLTSLISQFVGTSLNIIENEDKPALNRLKAKYPKEFKSLMSIKVKDVASYKLKMSLPTNIQFNQDLQGIHFQNGRFDLASSTFEERSVPNLDDPDSFISKVLPFDWTASSEESIKSMSAMIGLTFSSHEDFNYVMFVLGSALRGEVSDCSCLFHVGKGSSGKSTLLNFIIHALPLYVELLPSDVFDSKAIANRVLGAIKPTTRFLICNELNEAKKDSSVIKTVCDGEVVVTQLYRNGAFPVKINGKLFCTSNFVIAFSVDDDSGIERRIKYCVHSKHFTHNEAEVDNVKEFKAVDMPFKTMSDLDKVTVFNMLAPYASDDVGNHLVPPATILSCDTLLNVDQFLTTYFDAFEGSFVSIDVVMNFATAYFPDLKFTQSLLIDKILKRVPILSYNAKKEINGKKGAIFGMKLKGE